MAQGTLTVFEAFAETIGDGSHDLDNDTFKVMLISNQVGGTPTIAADDLTPDSGDYTEVVGTNYAPGGGGTAGAALTVTYSQTGGACPFTVTSGTITWTQHAAGPTDIRTALLYNTTHAGGNDAIAFIDMTANGVDPVSLVDGNITLTFEPDVFVATVVNP